MPLLSKKRDQQKFVGGFALSGLLGSGKASMLPLETLSLGLWVIAVDSAFIAGLQSIKNCGIWIHQIDHLPAVMTTSFWSSLSTLGTNFAQIFHIFSSSRIIVCIVPTLTSNCALIVSIDTRRSLSMKFFSWLINSDVLSSLLLPYLSSSLKDSLPSLNLLCHSKTDAQFMQDGPKAVWSIPYVSVAFFPSLKQNFIAYRSSKVSDYIFEIHLLWQSGFSRVYSNCCSSCSFEAEIIKIGQSSHKMYSNNIVNFQESTTILNSCTKIVWKLIESTSYIKTTCIFCRI